MATINKELTSAKAAITLEVGVTDSGSMKYRTKTFSGLNLDAATIAANEGATDTNVYEMMSALGTLQAYPVSAIYRVDNYALTRGA